MRHYGERRLVERHDTGDVEIVQGDAFE